MPHSRGVNDQAAVVGFRPERGSHKSAQGRAQRRSPRSVVAGFEKGRTVQALKGRDSSAHVPIRASQLLPSVAIVRP